MRTEDLVRMINQIADYFSAYPEDEAIAGIVGHLNAFWEPRMRNDLVAAWSAGEAKGLRDLSVQAVSQLA